MQIAKKMPQSKTCDEMNEKQLETRFGFFLEKKIHSPMILLAHCLCFIHFDGLLIVRHLFKFFFSLKPFYNRSGYRCFFLFKFVSASICFDQHLAIHTQSEIEKQ